MPQPLRVFLCHASQDKPAVKKLHRYLVQHGIKPWLDELDLLPGEDWKIEIPKALYASDVILVCLSKNSINKDGYVQKEISFALDKALEKSEGSIFIIPAKLEACDVPKRLERYQWVDLSRPDSYKRLLMGLSKKAMELGSEIEPVIIEDTRKRRSNSIIVTANQPESGIDIEQPAFNKEHLKSNEINTNVSSLHKETSSMVFQTPVQEQETSKSVGNGGKVNAPDVVIPEARSLSDKSESKDGQRKQKNKKLMFYWFLGIASLISFCFTFVYVIYNSISPDPIIVTDTPLSTKALVENSRPMITASNIGSLEMLRSFYLMGFIESISFSPDGSILAVSGGHGIWLYDLVNDTELPTLTAVPPVSTVHSVAFNSDGTVLYSGSVDDGGGQIRAWDWKSGIELWSEVVTIDGWGATISVNPDDSELVVSAAQTVSLWEINNPPILLKELDNTLAGAAVISPDGNLIAYWEEEGFVHLYNADINEERRYEVFGAIDYYPRVAFSYNSNYLTAGDGDGQLHVWRISDEMRLLKVKAHDAPINCVAFSPDGSVIVTAANDGLFKIWNSSTGDLIKTLSGDGGQAFFVAFSPDGRLLTLGTQSGVLFVWSIVP